MQHRLTTNGFTKCLFMLACALMGSGFAAASGAPPEGATVRVRVASLSSALPMSADSVVFQLAGNAPLNCAPNVAGAAVSGEVVQITTHWPVTGCDAGRSTRYALTVDAAALTGVALPRGPVYAVSVRDEAGDLLAFRAVDTDATRDGPRPETGFWWPQAEGSDAGAAAGGSGLSLELQGPQLAIHLFGFDGSGAPTWYFGSARSVDRVVTSQLVGLQQGDSLFAPLGRQPIAQLGPRIEIQFLSPTTARAWLVQNEDGRDRNVRELTLSRDAFDPREAGAARLAGRWVLVSDGELAPRQFDWWLQAGHSEGHAQLVNGDGTAVLDCRSDGNNTTVLACSLGLDGVTVAEFDQIGFDRLSGRGRDGTPTQLLRIPATR